MAQHLPNMLAMSTTNEIAPPEIGEHHPDRHLSCQQALEPAFQAVAEMAERSGWSAAEIAAALVDLADNHMLARAANFETDQMIEEIQR